MPFATSRWASLLQSFMEVLMRTKLRFLLVTLPSLAAAAATSLGACLAVDSTGISGGGANSGDDTVGAGPGGLFGGGGGGGESFTSGSSGTTGGPDEPPPPPD